MNWPEAYLPDVNRPRLDDWLKACGMSAEAGTWLPQTAADCRLAFARLVDTEVSPRGQTLPAESIISQTQTAPAGGRPATTRWALWTAYMVRDCGLSRTQTRIRSRDLADLVHILTGRQIPPAELRGHLGSLRVEANDHSSRSATALLKRPVRAELGDEEFATHFREGLGDLNGDAQSPPMIVDGRLSEAWLERLIKVRRAILRDVDKLGVLAGEPPTLRFVQTAQLYRGLPLGPPPPPTVHLGKGLDVQSPTVTAPTTISLSLNLATPPYAAALCALPRWWTEWEGALYLPMQWQAIPSETTGGPKSPP